MRIELKPFQVDAVCKLAAQLGKMRREYEDDGTPSSIGLSAPTGSGKTVIAASVIESLFFGNDEYGIEGDPRATVLWVSDSPSLNDQTRLRFVEASEKLAEWLADKRHMETVANDFAAGHEALDPGHVYFLNRQLIGKNGLLTKSSEVNCGRTFWDILDATAQDGDRNLYLFIDEAHRGLGSSTDPGSGTDSDDTERASTYSKLIDGHGGHMPAPMVVGISATGQRFEDAMESRATGRVHRPMVVVPPSEVQESGLLKDTVELIIPSAGDAVVHQELDMACEKLLEFERAWAEYCGRNDIEPPVFPLLVIQVADKIGEAALGRLCEQVAEKLPHLDTRTCFAHVFADHARSYHPSRNCFVPHIEPENVQESRSIRVLFAKEAISNGWDCPRAEVIYSQRKRSDVTYIAQLIGRMVRTPLARRVDGDDLLNSVACFLPKFDPDSTQTVIDYLIGKSDDLIGGSSVRKVITNPVTIRWYEPSSPDSPAGSGGTGGLQPATVRLVFTSEESEGIKQAWSTLRKTIRPKKPRNQFKALVDVATLLMVTKLDPGAGAHVHDAFCRSVVAETERYRSEYLDILQQVTEAEMRKVTLARSDGDETSSEDISRKTDVEGLREAAKLATRVFGGRDLVEAYRKLRITGEGMDEDDVDAALAALARTKPIVEALGRWAEDERGSFLEVYHYNKWSLTDEYRQRFDRLISETKGSWDEEVEFPTNLVVDGNLKRYGKHILYDSTDGTAPLDLNDLEEGVLLTELARPRTVGFYRIPNNFQSSVFSVPYRMPSGYYALRPDFIFFVRDAQNRIHPSIVDPHGAHIGDALAKLKGYVEFLDDERHKGMFLQVLSVSAVPSGGHRYLDLLDESTQRAIREHREDHTEALYMDEAISHPYPMVEGRHAKPD